MADPKLYRRMCEPHPNATSANAAVQAFFADLRALREKHKIADVLCTIRLNVSYGEDEAWAMAHRHIGATAEALEMAAYTLGACNAEQARIRNLLASGRGVTDSPTKETAGG